MCKRRTQERNAPAVGLLILVGLFLVVPLIPTVHAVLTAGAFWLGVAIGIMAGFAIGETTVAWINAPIFQGALRRERDALSAENARLTAQRDALVAAVDAKITADDGPDWERRLAMRQR